MKKAREFFCDIAPGCHQRVAIIIHPTDKALQIAFRATGGEMECEAFCNREEGKSDRLVTLHFCTKYLTAPVIAHEVFHGVLELIRVTRLNMNDEYAQEVAAHAVSHLMGQVAEAIKLSRRSARR